MSTDIVVPSLGESVSEAIVARWFKAEGESVEADEPIVELETDKVTLEVNAPQAGTLQSIQIKEGETVEVGTVLGQIGAGKGSPAKAAPKKEEKAATPAPAAKEDASDDLSPAVRRLVEENNLNPTSIPATGKGGRLTKEDVVNYMDGTKASAPAAAPVSFPSAGAATPAASGERREERVRMTMLRRKIAQRLKESQNTAAILTTFNEIDMSNVMAMRSKYKEAVEKKYGVRLGFMSFFTKAAVHALKEIPEVNAQIDGDEIIYKHYYDVGVAVGTEQGLVVPVIRNADSLSLVQVDEEIANLAKKARDGKLSMDELTGGTFTISNGGVYGSLLATPIINPPQSGILGLHKIEKRPVVVNDEVVIRPMMYIALSYDHRIIDGRESVTFLKRVKEYMEDPERLLLEV